jgi:hypothetical protein
MNVDPDDRDSPRFKMIDDLGRKHLLVGTDKTVVLRELGQPTQIMLPGHFGYAMVPSDVAYVWSYEIGAWSGWRMDMDYLAIGFSSSDKIVTHWVWQS